MSLLRRRRRRREDLPKLRPPRRLVGRAAGRGALSFHEIGERWVETMRTWGGLEPHHRVLDIGCGAGRMAIALSQFLDETGTYDGFDVQEQAIDWCRTEIEPRWPHSRFRVVDVGNAHYRRDAAGSASTFRFPYDDASFDFAFMTSVLTHMPRDEAENYVAETARVLRPGGRCLITYFLVNGQVRDAIRDGKARYAFAHEVQPGCFVEKPHDPGEVVGYEEDVARAMFAAAGLRIEEPVRHGGWSGAYPGTRHGQDAIVASR